MNSLFGVGLPTAVNVVIAFVVVLVLIGLAAWLVRRFGATRLDATGRSRQPRLAVIDSAAVDGRRKLVIIRRDNVEHLLMIGGPNDVVVESAIVRGAIPATRDAPVPRAALPDSSAWVTPSEPVVVAPPVAPMVRVERERPRVVAEEPAQWPPAQAEPAAEPAPSPVVRATREPTSARPAPAPAAARSSRADVLAGFAAELAKPAPEPARPAPEAPRPAPASRPATLIDPAFSAAADKNLAEMAQRLEQALRQPPTAAATPATPQPVSEAQRVEPKPAVASPPTTPTKSDLENFEQEMATLLGRSGKT